MEESEWFMAGFAAGMAFGLTIWKRAMDMLKARKEDNKGKEEK